MESLLELLDCVLEALVIGRINPDTSPDFLEVKAMNQAARGLLARTEQTDPLASLNQLITSQTFLESLALACSTGNLISGPLGILPDRPDLSGYTYGIKNTANDVMIWLGRERLPRLVAIGEHMQHNPLIRIAIFESVRNEAGELENLRLTHKNLAAIEHPALRVSIDPGQLLTDWYPSAKETGLFPQFVQVIETGVPLVTGRYYPELNEGYEMVVTRKEDGVIISYYNSVEKRQARRFLAVWQKIIDSSEDNITVLCPLRDEQGRIVDFSIELINEAAMKTGRLTRSQVADYTLGQLSTATTSLIPQYAGVMETGVPLRVDRVLHRGDEIIYMDVSASRLNDRLLIIARDMTASQLVIQDLERQQNLLDGIINTSENLMFVAVEVYDETGKAVDLKIVKDNQRASRNFGGKLEGNILGQSPRAVYGENKELFELSRQVMETGQPVTIEQLFEERSGRWYRIFFRKVEHYLVVSFADITEIQEARLVAEQRNTLLSAIMENSLDGVLAMEAVRDSQGIIQDFIIRIANQLAVEATSISMDKLTGTTYGSLFPQVIENGFHTELVQAAREGGSLRKEQSFYSSDKKRLHWFDLSMTPASNDIFVLSFRDITEIVGWRKEQERLLNELQRSNRSLEQFAYVASHDLQEPARKIKAFGGLVMKQYAASIPESGQDMLQRMVSASERMQGMIDSLLMYSRFSNQPSQLAEVSLQRVVELALADLDITIRDSNADIRAGILPTVTGNETQLYQLFLNLINNALKFISKHERPLIRISSGPPSRQDLLQLGFDPHQSWHAIRVSDNGIGFDESNRTRIFELFRRLHGQSEYSGSGMGLAICKIVAEQHGGGITVYSTPGVGTTFVVLLPATPVFSFTEAGASLN